MHISPTIWEYFINFIEIFLFYIFISTKLHATNTLNHRFLLQFLFLLARFAVLCIMNVFHISPTLTLCFTCFLEILFAFLFYTDSSITKFFWGFMYSAICIVADYITLLIPQTFSKVTSREILINGTLRIPFSILYIALVAVFVFLFQSIKNPNITLSFPQEVSYFAISVSGILIGHYMMILTMESENKFHDSSFTSSMIFATLCFIMLFLSLLLYIYQLGYSKELNKRLQEKQKIHQLEKSEYENLIQSTATLREMKHDIDTHLNVIQSLVDNGEYDKLLSYIHDYHCALEETHHLLSTGNTAIDCILSSKIHRARKLGIRVEFSIIAPQVFPLDAIALSSLLGNLWNNALEACQHLMKTSSNHEPLIQFYIKPFQQMVLIHIENNFYGNIIMQASHTYASTKSEKDHGIGLKRINDIVEHANGIIQIDPSDHIFRVHIMIPMTEATHENKDSNS